MPEQSPERIDLLQGTLDMLILRTLLFGPAHGHQITKHIRQSTKDVLQVEHGSLYPALHRLERKGWIAARWETAKELLDVAVPQPNAAVRGIAADRGGIVGSVDTVAFLAQTQPARPERVGFG